MGKARYIEVPEIKVVKKELADGSHREYHYYKGCGPSIWQTGCGYEPGSQEYWTAFVEARERAGDLYTPQPGPSASASRKSQTSNYQAEAEQLIRAAHASGLTVRAIELANGRISIQTERAKEEARDRSLRENT